MLPRSYRGYNLIPAISEFSWYTIRIGHIFLPFGTIPAIHLSWRCYTGGGGDQEVTSHFAEFAHVLGYPFQGCDTPCGARMHEGHQTYDVKKLKPLYYKGGFAGQAKNLPKQSPGRKARSRGGIKLARGSPRVTFYHLRKITTN